MEFIRVEDCCEILDSQRKPVTESERVPGMYPYYGANGIQGTINQYIFDDKLVLVAEDGGHFGSKTKPIAYLVNGKCWVNNHAHVLRTKKGFLAEYVCYSLMFYKIEGYINGATRQKLTQAALRKLIIPKRSVEDQQAIVDRLDLVKCIIEQKQNIINELDLLIKSRFVELFGDPNIVESNKCVRFNSIAKIITGNTPSRKSTEYYGDYIEWIKSDNIVNTDLYISQAKEFLSEQGAAKGRVAPKDSLLMTCIAGSMRSIGNVGLCDRTVAFNQQINAIVLKHNINPLYVYWLLKLFKPSIIANVEMSLKGIISKSQLENMFIPMVAPKKEQDLFAKFVLQINKLKVDVQKSIDETQLLMDSLMQEYFG